MSDNPDVSSQVSYFFQLMVVIIVVTVNFVLFLVCLCFYNKENVYKLLETRAG